MASASSSYPAARVRVASSHDADRLETFFEHAWPDRQDGTDAWLERGGALLLEDDDGVIACALCWLERRTGWQIEGMATRPDARGQGYGRWLMTKVEALAIRANVPLLTLDLREPAFVRYYQRMGYRVAEQQGETLTLAKNVGGTWQTQLEPAP